MLTRISLIVAIIAGLAVGALNFKFVREKIVNLQTHLQEQTEARQKAENELAVTKRDLDKTKTDLAQTKQTLQTTIAEKQKAVALADEKTKEAAKLSDDLNKTQKQLSDAQAERDAYRASGLNPAQVSTLTKDLKQRENELVEAQVVIRGWKKKYDRTQAELDKYTSGEQRIVYLPANLKGKVIVSDPKWNFVVLNIGDDQDVKEDGELLVSRDGRLVAKVKVTSVQKNRCIANVMPGWKLGQVMEGDEVVPAHPAS